MTRAGSAGNYDISNKIPLKHHHFFSQHTFCIIVNVFYRSITTPQSLIFITILTLVGFFDSFFLDPMEYIGIITSIRVGTVIVDGRIFVTRYCVMRGMTIGGTAGSTYWIDRRAIAAARRRDNRCSVNIHR